MRRRRSAGATITSALVLLFFVLFQLERVILLLIVLSFNGAGSRVCWVRRDLLKTGIGRASHPGSRTANGTRVSRLGWIG
jgi:hypothetical protein